MGSLIGSGTIRPQGLFARQLVLAGQAHSIKHGLRQFLTQDADGAVFYKEYPVHRERLYLGLKSGNEEIKVLGGLRGISKLFVGVREETLSAIPVKVLYGWKSKNDWGAAEKVVFNCVLAEKRDGRWQILLEPTTLSALTEQQQLIRANRALTDALTGGLGGAVLRRFWNVNRPSARLTYSFYGRQSYLDGFQGYEKVFSLITEEDGKIFARFYANEADADQGERLIKGLVLAKKGTDGGWAPLSKPELFFATPSSSTQYAHLVNSRIKSFLLAEQAVGAAHEIGERTVIGGSIRLHLPGGYVQLAGFTGFDAATGTIVNEGEEKIFYAWPAAVCKEAGALPIVPRGQVVARRNDGKWEIVWFDLDWGNREAREATVKLGNFLFATAGDRTRTDLWPVKQVNIYGRRSPMLLRTIRQNAFNLSVTGIEGVNGRVVSQVREFGRRLKLIEFWPNEDALDNNEAPFAARLITFNLNGHSAQKGGTWVPFWHKVDGSAATLNAFKKLVREEVIGFNELSDILGDNHFFYRGYPVFGIIDALNPDI